MTRRILLASLFALLSSGCLGSADESPSADEDLGMSQSNLTSAERMVRAAQIRDAAGANGITQGWLLAGIADAETGMSQCWSELTWACQGPASADCGGGPVVAGAGDGPCSLQQGGLGMFQFDAGTFADTLAREGDRVLSIDGNVAAGVDFVVSMVIRSTYVSGVDNATQAVEWINGVRIGNDRWDPWIRTVTHYYNGCRPSYSCFTSRYAHYRDNTTGVYDEMGAAFWSVSNDFGAEYVSQSFPLASAEFELTAGAESAGFIEMRNTGTETWTPGTTMLGTSQPRDAASPFAGADWVSPHRPATVDRSVAPGETGRFPFTLHAPATPGEYSQFFNLVQEGVTWFGDQGGPRDDLLQVRVVVLEAPPCPTGQSETWSCDGGARVRCVFGETERQSCAMGCVDATDGAVCASAGGDDADGDGSSSTEDCDDGDPARYPGAWDFCEDGVDQDCDGRDRLCSELVDGAAPGADAGPGGGSGMGRGSVSGSCSATASRAPGGAGFLWVLGVAMIIVRRRR